MMRPATALSAVLRPFQRGLSTSKALKALKPPTFSSSVAALPKRNVASVPVATAASSANIRGVLLDWSGTCADIFVIAPAISFVKVFEKHNEMKEARGPMGLRKDVHLSALLNTPSIRKKWEDVHGPLMTPAAVSATVAMLFRDFMPLQIALLPNYTALIPGTAEAVRELRSADLGGVKIGMTTGFQRPLVDILLKNAIRQGFEPDTCVAGCEVEKPRPWPQMVFENMRRLQLNNVREVVKVDDTLDGIGEGNNAGTWTVGLYQTSNYMDIDSLDHFNSLSDAEITARAKRSYSILEQAKPHYLIPSIAGLPAVVRDINKRLAKGERP